MAKARFIKKIQNLRSQLRRRVMLAGALEIFGRLAAIIAILVIFDRGLVFTIKSRWVLWFALIAGAGLCLLRGIVFRLMGKKWEDLQVALLVEQRMGRLGETLAAAVDFNERLQSGPNEGSVFFMNRVIRDVENETRTADLKGVLPKRRLKRASLEALIAALILAPSLALDGQNGLVCFKRILLPWGAYQIPTRNALIITLEGARGEGENRYVAALGEKLTVSARAASEPPAKVFVTMKMGLATRTSYSATAGLDGTYRVELPKLKENATVIVSGGDFHPEPIQVRAVARPEPSETRMSVKYPPYTALNPETQSGTQLAGVLGTEGTLTVRFQQGVKGCSLKGAPPGVAVTMSDPATALLNLRVDGSRAFELDAVSPEGFSLAKPIQVRVEMWEDRLAQIEILKPGTDLDLTRAASVPIVFKVKDDYGIKTIHLAYQRNDRPEERTALFSRADPAPQQKLFNGSLEWSLAEMELIPSDRIAYWLEAADFSLQNEGQKAQSRKFHINIVDPRRALEGALASFFDLVTRLEAIRNYQRSTVDLAALLSRDTPPGASLPDVERRTRQTASDLADVIAQIAAIEKETERNKLASSPEYRLLATTNNKLSELVTGPVQAAVRASEAGLAAPRQEGIFDRIHKSQVDVLEGLNGVLSNLSKSQSLAEVAGKLNELAEAQKKLAASTEELIRQALGLNDQTAGKDKTERLSREQKSLAAQVETAASKLAELAGQYYGTDDAAFNSATGAMTAMERADVRGMMNEAAAHLRNSLFGRANSLQNEAASQLASAAAMLTSPAEGRNGPAASRPDPSAKPQDDNYIPFLYSLLTALLAVRDKQTLINKTTDELAAKADSRASKVKLQQLAGDQTATATQTDEIAGHLTDQPAAVFRLVLTQVAQDMKSIAGQLSEGQAQEDTRSLQLAVLAALDELVSALASEGRELRLPSSLEKGNGPGDNNEPPPPSDKLRLLNPVNELKMIRLIQIRAMAETLEASRLAKGGKTAEADTLRLKAAETQQKITELLGQMLSSDFED